MEQAGEVDYLITWKDEFVGRVSLVATDAAPAQYRAQRHFCRIRVGRLRPCSRRSPSATQKRTFSAGSHSIGGRIVRH